MKYPWYKKINPLWWFGNANDPVNGVNPDGTPKHPNFHPTKPTWIRKVLWGIRNPLHNLFFFVIGLNDRPDIVNCGNMWPKEGQKWNIILPFICYKGKKREWYLGWRNGKTLGAAFRRANAKGM
jgi:hypothetical protein